MYYQCIAHVHVNTLEIRIWKLKMPYMFRLAKLKHASFEHCEHWGCLLNKIHLYYKINQ